MRVIRATSAGFCLGVSLALKRLEGELALFERKKGAAGRLATLGPVIHNPLVMRGYAERGVLCLESPEGVKPGDRVVIRAHGVPREVEAALERTGARLIDATCPRVKAAQLAIARACREGGELVLFGERDHPEVRGLLSYAGPGALVFGEPDELSALAPEPERPWFLAAQTTQERAIYERARLLLAERLGRDVPVLDTICDATRERQQGVIDLCAGVDAVVVVGGLNSGNTRRLAEVARAAGAFALHVEQPSDIKPDDLARLRGQARPLGLTAGASTPEEHIEAMQDFLERMQPLGERKG